MPPKSSVSILVLSAVAMVVLAANATAAKPTDSATPDQGPNAKAKPTADVARGETLFRPCASCHEIGEAARAKIGPALTGIVGRRIASERDFEYSAALKKISGKKARWTAEKLSAYLAAPAKFAPGNKMAFAGVKKSADRRDLIAYLASLTLLPERNPLPAAERSPADADTDGAQPDQ